MLVAMVWLCRWGVGGGGVLGVGGDGVLGVGGGGVLGVGVMVYLVLVAVECLV